MKLKLLDSILIIQLVHLVDFYEASLHTWGSIGYWDRNKLVETKLFEHNSTKPKNYTLIYKYFQNYMKPVAYFEINVNSESNGYINRSTSTQAYYGTMREIFIFNAEIHVNVATNVVATLTIYENGYVPFTYVLEGGPENNQSITYVYMKDAFPSRKPFFQNSIGKRQTGDELLHFETGNVANQSRFPRKAFSYNGEEHRAYLTYVSFSFNSPTAIALVNASFVTEQDFNAIVYDLNRDHFVANFSVYGIKDIFRPSGFSAIIQLNADYQNVSYVPTIN